MTAHRRYRLLCPIARALDVLGDRWTLLILRDLHAGPARFQELQAGLGIATNLLSTRLAELTDAGMIERIDSPGASGYQLTAVGRRSDRVLWELVRFGTAVERETDPREPGNLRTIALPLRMLLESVPDRPRLRATLLVDDAEFTITSTAETVDVEWGRSAEPTDVTARTSYRALLDVGEGLLSFDEFASNHIELVAGAARAPVFLALMAAAMSSEAAVGADG